MPPNIPVNPLEDPTLQASTTRFLPDMAALGGVTPRGAVRKAVRPSTPESPQTGFWDSALYGATGYKNYEGMNDSLLGIMAGEIAGVIGTSAVISAATGPLAPVTATVVTPAIALLRGIKVYRSLRRASRVTKVMSNKAGRSMLQKIGFSPSSAKVYAKHLSDDLGTEMLFQTGKLGVGLGTGTEDTPGVIKGTEIGMIAATVPVGNVAGRFIIGRASRGIRKLFTPKEIDQLNKRGEVVKNTSRSEVKNKENDLVRNIREQESIKTQLTFGEYYMEQTLIKAGLKTPEVPPTIMDEVLEGIPNTETFDPPDEIGVKRDPTAKEAAEGRTRIEDKEFDDSWDTNEVKVGERRQSLMSKLRENFLGRSANSRHYFNQRVKQGKITDRMAEDFKDALDHEINRHAGTQSIKSEAFKIVNNVGEENYSEFSKYDFARSQLEHMDRWAADNPGMPELKVGPFTRQQLESRMRKIHNLANGKEYKGLDDQSEEIWERLQNPTPEQLATKEAASRIVTGSSDLQKWKSENILTRLYKEGALSGKAYVQLLNKPYTPRIFFQFKDKDKLKLTLEDIMGQVDDELHVGGVGRLNVGADSDMITDAKELIEYSVAATERTIARNRIANVLADMATNSPDNGFARWAREVVQDTGSPNPEEQYKTVWESAIGTDEFGGSIDGKSDLDFYVRGESPLAHDLRGKRQRLIVDEQILKDLQDKDPYINGGGARLLYATQSPLKKAAVYLDPYFAMFVNPVLEIGTQFGADYMGVRSSFFPKFLMQVAEEFKDNFGEIVRGDGEMTRALIRWGGNIQSFSQEAGTPLRAQLDKKAIEAQRKSIIPKGVGKGLDKMAHYASFLTKKSELSFRLGLFRRTIKHYATKEGISFDEAFANERIVQRAARYTNEYMNFADDARVYRTIDTIAPFTQAMATAARGQIRSITKNPRLYAWKASQAVAVASSAAVASYAINPSEYQKIPSQTKASNFVLMTPWTKTFPDGRKQSYYLKVRKDDFMAPFMSLGEAIASKMITGEVDTDQLFDSFERLGSLIDPRRVGSNPVVSAYAAYFMNKDIWNNNDIWTPYKPVSPNLEYTDRTSQLAKDVGNFTGASPDRLESAFGKLFTNNNPFLQVSGLAYRLTVTAASGNRLEEEAMVNAIIKTLPLSGNYVGITPRFPQEAFEIAEEIKIRETSGREERNKTLYDLLKRKQIGSVTQREITNFINMQPLQERKRLETQIRFEQRTGNLYNMGLLRSVASIPPDGRPEAIVRIYGSMESNEDRAKFLEEVPKYPGLVTRNDFWSKFNEIESSMSGRGLNL